MSAALMNSFGLVVFAGMGCGVLGFLLGYLTHYAKGYGDGWNDYERTQNGECYLDDIRWVCANQAPPDVEPASPEAAIRNPQSAIRNPQSPIPYPPATLSQP